jgi:integrase
MGTRLGTRSAGTESPVLACLDAPQRVVVALYLEADLQRFDVQMRFGQQRLELAVLGFDVAQPLGVAGLHAAQARSPLVERGVTEAAEEADLLLAELPPHLRDMAAFSLESGLRAANVTGLRWSAVDLSRRLAWVHPDEAKARKAIPVPLNGEAVTILQKQIGKYRDVVFTFKGQPVVQVSTAAWYRAMNRAGIETFRWHDLRHTWASWHVQSGTPLNVLQELGGWASYSMVQRYAHLAADHLAPWADRLAESKTRRGTNLAQRSIVQRIA